MIVQCFPWSKRQLLSTIEEFELLCYLPGAAGVLRLLSTIEEFELLGSADGRLMPFWVTIDHRGIWTLHLRGTRRMQPETVTIDHRGIWTRPSCGFSTPAVVTIDHRGIWTRQRHWCSWKDGRVTINHRGIWTPMGPQGRPEGKQLLSTIEEFELPTNRWGMWTPICYYRP